VGRALVVTERVHDQHLLVRDLLMRPRGLLLLGVVIVVAGCGGTISESGKSRSAAPAAGTTTTPTTTTTSLPIAPPQPIPFSARNLDGFTAVVRNAFPGPGAHLPFGLVVPAIARVPAAVFVANPDALPPTVIVQYPSKSPFGAFWIREDNPPGVDQSTIAELAAQCISCTEHALVQIAPGITAALLAGPYGPTSVTWLEKGLHLVVIGPPQSFSTERAIAVARATAAVQAR
jgi:hypothetical protein